MSPAQRNGITRGPVNAPASPVADGLRSVAPRADNSTADPATTNITDPDILNFALTLEHLENNFYSGGLSKFTEDDFTNAGLPVWAYARTEQIANNEAAHVQYLQALLGSQAAQPCNYSFPYNDPQSFMQLAQSLEGVGTSAYEYALAAATLLSTEARQAGWIASAVRKEGAWSGPFELAFTNSTDLLPGTTITLQFTPAGTGSSGNSTGSPASAASPPSTTTSSTDLGAAPSSSSDPTSTTDSAATPFSSSADFAIAPSPTDSTIPINSTSTSNATTPLYAAFLSGHNAFFSPLDAQNNVQIPVTLRGTVYLLVTNSTAAVDDASTQIAAMHKVLTITEIVVAIIEALSRWKHPIHTESDYIDRDGISLPPSPADALALALTCKTFLNPALDALWSVMYSMEPLLKCLVPHDWERCTVVLRIGSAPDYTFQLGQVRVLRTSHPTSAY
ncbi:hypothetical protein EWM64_g6527 [Hericium alpestre]|uniref:Uncharacterized protein n=1 Tax=Hericium alpestre TaxID=135208 RepID=A0A4Y9ZRH8_9AGAM|nr:hypothetical protein EWM64_g6527 [Hericium alpestre]